MKILLSILYVICQRIKISIRLNDTKHDSLELMVKSIGADGKINFFGKTSTGRPSIKQSEKTKERTNDNNHDMFFLEAHVPCNACVYSMYSLGLEMVILPYQRGFFCYMGALCSIIYIHVYIYIQYHYRSFRRKNF